MTNKIEEFELRIRNAKPHFAYVSEVLQKNIKNPIYKEFFELEGYEMIPHKNIDDNVGRGSILFTRKDIVGKEVDFKIPRTKDKFEEGIFYELNLKGRDKLLCACIYRRGESDDKNNELLLKLFNIMSEKSTLILSL